jgi:hypothetical protein
MKNSSTIKRHAGLEKDLNICPKSGGGSDFELTGGPHEVAGDLKVNGKGVVLGIGKSDVFDFIKGLK